MRGRDRGREGGIEGGREGEERGREGGREGEGGRKGEGGSGREGGGRGMELWSHSLMTDCRQWLTGMRRHVHPALFYCP